jgi:predicted RNase H-like HicB family nuclease
MEKYTVIVHEEPEGGYWAELPALPGCYSQGDTLSELMENVREAISGVLAVMREHGTQRAAGSHVHGTGGTGGGPSYRRSSVFRLFCLGGLHV